MFLRDVAFDETFEIGERTVLAFGDEGDGIAFSLGATGAANAVDIVLVLVGEVVVDDVGDAGDIDSTGGDIGADKNAQFALFKLIEGALALVLSSVAVDRFGGDVRLTQMFREATGVMLHRDKDENGVEFRAFEKMEEERELEVAGNFVDALAYGFCGVSAVSDFYR